MARSKPAPLEVRHAYYEASDLYAPLKINAEDFEIGFEAGREFQFRQIQRLLCKYCMAKVPLTEKSGVQVHEVLSNTDEDMTWNIVCEAARILPLGP